MRYRVEQLAAACDVSVDTIRYYQTRGLVPAPTREGRLAWYDERHVERIGEVRELRRRGLTLAAIGRVLGDGLDAADADLAVAVAAARGEAREATAPAPLPFFGLEQQLDVNYDVEGIRAVASEAAGAVEAAAGGETAGALASGAEDSAQRTGDARGCVRQSGLQDPRDVLIRLIEAEFEGTPAYIAVFAEGPGAGQPPDHIVVWVVATDDCRILTSASQRIPPG